MACCCNKVRFSPSCIICHKIPFGGINGGLLIGTRLICSDCEKEILYTPVDDSTYDNLVEGIKRLWN